jgi:hypothetical protein
MEEAIIHVLQEHVLEHQRVQRAAPRSLCQNLHHAVAELLQGVAG